MSQDCRSYEDLISQWIFEDNVDEKTLAPVKGHIKTCESCKRLKNEYQMIAGDLSQEDLPTAPPALKQNVMASLNQSSRRSPRSKVTWFALAASILIIVGVVMNNLPNDSANDQTRSIALESSPEPKTYASNANAGLLIDEERIEGDAKSLEAMAPTITEGETALKKRNFAFKEQSALVYKIESANLEAFKAWCTKNNYTLKEIKQNADTENKRSLAQVFKPIHSNEFEKKDKNKDIKKTKVANWLFFELTKKPIEKK